LQLVENSADGAKDPVEIVRRIAREKVEYARQNYWEGPPFNPRHLASILGMDCKAVNMQDRDDARLVPLENNRLRIEYNADKPETRQNYSIAHEVAHTFFPDYKEQIQMRKQNPEHRDSEVEKLCEIGAAEMLLPNPYFRNDLSTAGGVSIDSFDYLRDRYRASREATANRMIRNTSKSCAVVYYRFKLKPKEIRQIQAAKEPSLFPVDDDFEKQFLKKLRVDYSVASDSFGVFIPKHKSLDEASPINNVALNGIAFKGKTGISVDRERVVDFYVEAIPYPCDESWGLYNGVIAFLFPQ